jgi:glycosyltransferase involved in cell wall biosynthesis
VTSAEPIRIARIITRLNVGGPAIQAITLSEQLESAGYHTLLIHGRVGSGEGDMSYLIPSAGRFEVESLNTLRRKIAPLSDATALTKLVERLREFRPHIVHTHMAKAGSLGRLAALIANLGQSRQSRARIVHTYHGHVLEGYFSGGVARAFSAAERFLGHRSDALIAVSPSIRQDLLNLHRIGTGDRFHVVPLGFNLRRFAAIGPAERTAARHELGVDPTARVVSLVGRLTAIKQPDQFVTAAAQIAAAVPNAIFLIAGGGELEPRLRIQATSAGLDSRLRFLGWRQDVATVYAASDLIALTSRNEGTPVALIESMAAAVPGVAFAVGGVPDVITTDITGVLVRPNDLDAFVVRTVALLRDDGQRRRLGERARTSVLESYGLDRLVRDIDALYRQLL